MLTLVAIVAISAQPAVLHLGQDKSAELRVACAHTPSVSTSAGKIAGLSRDADGTWTARLLAPGAHVPAVALVAAVCGDDAGFLPVPLYGRGIAEVKTRPDATVDVRIGEQTFGPVRADKQGKAMVPVEVPPGVDFAQQGPRSIDLHVPRTPTVLLAVESERVGVDHPREVWLWAFTSTRAGAAADMPTLALSVTRGTLSEREIVAPGVSRARWKLEAGTTGEARAVARAPGEHDPAELRIALVAGTPAVLHVALDRELYVAGEGPVLLRADARDAAGNAVDPELQVEATGAEVTRCGRDVCIAPSPRLAGASALHVEARAGEARASADLRLLPGPPADIALETENDVRADGRTMMKVRARVRDRFGNDVPAAPVITADQGTVSALEQHGDAWEGVYLPPRLFERSSTALSARAADATTTKRIALAPGVHPLAAAARFGFLTNRRELHTPFAGAELTVRSDRFGPELGLALTLDGTSWSRTSLADTSGGVLQVHSAFTLLLASLGPVYRRPFGTRFAAFAQAGGVLALASTSAGVTASATASAHGAVPGLMAGAGVEAALYRTKLFVDLRYVATRAFALGGLDGSLHALAIAAGCRLELF